MPDAELTGRFEAICASGAGEPWALARAARQGEVRAMADLCALLTRVGFVEPALIPAAYDAAAAGWFGEASAPADLTAGTGSPHPGLWPPFWEFIDDASKMDAGAFTLRVAGLGVHVDAQFAERAGQASLSLPGVPAAVAQGWPERFSMQELAACPDGSLGDQFRRQITENNFDLEVLDRDSLGLRHLPPPLDYLNARALQCHDLWHLVGGYHLTALHETAISAFQLAQFGHNYSAQFLAFVATTAALWRPEGAPLLFEIIFSGWRHGRQTPCLLGVDWRGVWNAPAEDVRQRLGVRPYPSPFPPDLVEQLERAGMA